MTPRWMKAALIGAMIFLAACGHDSAGGTTAASSTTTGEDLYISQSGAGKQTAVDCANAHSVDWFNSNESWLPGAGYISPGDRLHICGIITTDMQAQGSGTAGKPITIYLEPNAKFSQPVGGDNGHLYLGAKSYFIIDCGVNGGFENTDNGSLLGHQDFPTAIYATSSHDIEVTQCYFKNLFVHEPNMDPDTPFDYGQQGGYHCQDCGANQYIHDNRFDQSSGHVLMLSPTTTNLNWRIQNNYFANHCWAIRFGGNVDVNPGNVTISGNEFDGGNDSWHTAVRLPPDPPPWQDPCHHDHIHLFHTTPSVMPPYPTISGVSIYNNYFHGNWGNQGTAHVYLEGIQLTPMVNNGIDDVSYYNNLHIVYPGTYVSNGIVAIASSNTKLYNNTFIGGGTGNSDFDKCVNINTGIGMRVINNIMMNCYTIFLTRDAFTSTNADFNNNLYYNGTVWSDGGAAYVSYPDIDNWRTITSAEGGSLIGDALLSATGYPQLGSATINRGMNLWSLGLTALRSDKDGLTRPEVGAWEIGAQSLRD